MNKTHTFIDLSEILKEWAYDEIDDSNNFRFVEMDDGRRIVQVRHPLGLTQMEHDGRPDGLRPMGYDSWLDCYKVRSGEEPDFAIEEEEMQNLVPEGLLYYQRRLILLQMGDWLGVMRDSQRSLDYFDFVRSHARHEEDWLSLEQYRPYVIRMRAFGESQSLREQEQFGQAIAALHEAIQEIQSLDEISTEIFAAEKERSLQHLAELIDEFEIEKPETEIEMLERMQDQAVDEEDYELAAEIRDQILILRSA